MKCGKTFVPRPEAPSKNLPEAEGVERPLFPDTLTDRLTGNKIPFSNRDNIRQKILGFLIEDKGYRKEDLRIDRQIGFDLDGQKVISLVDISVILGGKTVMVWKCASGSLVSRERQIIAAARLLEDYVVPFAAVTNGADLELLDSLSEKVIGSGFGSVPSREEMVKKLIGVVFRPVKGKKIANEQRILYTYDGISCPVSCKSPGGK